MRSLLTIIGILGIGFLLLKQEVQGFFSKLAINSVSLKYGGFTAPGIPLTIQVEIKNNSNLSIEMEGLDAVISYNGIDLAPVFIIEPVSITANSFAIIPFKTIIRIADLSADVLEIVTNKLFINNPRLKGNLYAEGISFPVDQVITII